MSTPPKKRVEGGRVTPKGGPSGSRYNAPADQSDTESPTWVQPVMFGLLLLGVVIIFFNYVSWLPGGMNNGYLLLGLGSILGGIITATRLH
ncbi:MAG: hypothetical protein CL441_09175 [Acidimicrobiaceae bacterium]|jgi:hypothetical protein|nr:hypothetical protein [Acidimicrobiaceae bacterium]|tara:strand:+ start:42 stop:314 length:273 start_codon:yes stop_codon:yes gene_type:complete